MLVKQVWRMIHDTDSLFCKFFKVKYFLNGSVFEAKSASGSFAWKSIIRSRNLIARGARWRVRDGKNTRIFQDAWLPNLNDGRIIFHWALLASNATIDVLINPQSSWWNMSLIDQCYPFDAHLIKSLPLCTTPQPNSLIWPVERNGHYLIKTGYKALCEESQVVEDEMNDSEAYRNFWKLKVPGKIKHFLWKSCTNSLPTKVNLLKRTILQEDVCHLCSKNSKDVLHALWGCEKVHQVWQRKFGWLDSNQVALSSFLDLAQLV